MEEAEKSKEMEDLYLPPRSRKTLQQINESDNKGKKKKKAQSGEDSEDDEETGSDEDGSDDGRPKKRGRPRMLPRENVKSFMDVEVSDSTET